MRSEQVYRISKSYETLSSIAKNIAENIYALENTDERFDRLATSNGRRGITRDIVGQALYGDRLSFNDYGRVIETFARDGDPLANGIHDALKDEDIFRVMAGNQIPMQLITRMMSEHEYNAYLNGKKPFATYKHKKYFLRKDH